MLIRGSLSPSPVDISANSASSTRRVSAKIFSCSTPAEFYVAAVGILHYIASHWYQPPPQFIDAVLSCAATRTKEYKKLFLSNGGTALLREPA